MICSTVYVSTMVDPVDREALDALLATSQANNARLGITGMLIYRRGNVMQLLEGREDAVSDLYRRISHDPRHHSVLNVWSGSSADRRFPDWSMAFDDLDSVPEVPGSGDGSGAVGSASVGDEGALLSRLTAQLAEAGTTRPELAAQQEAIARRAVVLRRALVSGDRLVTALAVILHGHRPESVLAPGGSVHVRCGECRTFQTAGLDSYPCATANQAIWALGAVLR